MGSKLNLLGNNSLLEEEEDIEAEVEVEDTLMQEEEEKHLSTIKGCHLQP